ncbi:MAG: helix-turn-helix transcriptional regulator [Clostridia bacterium]|nr:helix-turn-helix transcriptional regulator [Clostridia bacterium]
MSKFAQRLKELREEKGLTISQLALGLQVSIPCVSRWEANLRIPNADNIVLVCNFFNVSADYILGIKDY